jgi:serine/threonine protein kinase
MSAILETGALLHKRYEIIEPLGGGDFGTVYQAHDRRAKKNNRQVALKQMPPQMIIACERQAELRANLRHPAIPRILAYFATEEHAYLVQELIEGCNLERLLEAHSGFLPEKRVVGWGIQLCAVLDFLHNHPHHPIIFRDLKPNNIMVDQTDQVHLVDFELIRAFPAGYFQEVRPEWKHYEKGLPIGTEGYSPPEQYRGRVRPQSDIYALGATMHHLLTRRDPRKQKPFTFAQYPIRALNPDLSPGLEVIVMQAVNKDIERRFSTAKAMQAALEAVFRGIT